MAAPSSVVRTECVQHARAAQGILVLSPLPRHLCYTTVARLQEKEEFRELDKVTAWHTTSTASLRVLELAK